MHIRPHTFCGFLVAACVTNYASKVIYRHIYTNYFSDNLKTYRLVPQPHGRWRRAVVVNNDE